MNVLSLARTALTSVADHNAVRIDEARFHLLYERTARPLRGYLIRALNNAATADDLLQESYLRLLKANLPAEASDEHLKNYLFRIATNLIKGQQSGSGRKEVELHEEMAAADKMDDGDAQRMLAALKPAQRQLLWLAYVERFSHFEIAGMLKLKPQSIRPLLSRARHALAETLQRTAMGKGGGK